MAEGLKKIHAPIAFIARGKETGKEPSVILGACWSVGGPFCVELGGKYAVFEPQTGAISFTNPKECKNPLPDAAFLYRLSRIEDQATYPVLDPLGALMQPSETEKSLFERFVSHFQIIPELFGPVSKERPGDTDRGRDGEYLHQPQ